MAKYYCKCLNVAFEYYEDDRIERSLLSEEEEGLLFQLPFILKVSLCRCKVSKQQSALIDTKMIGSWNVYKCINCALYTHAERNDTSLAILLNSPLKELNDQELYTVKQSLDFSPVFNIVVSNHSCLTDQYEPSHSIGEISNVIIGELKSQLTDAVDDQSKKTDALIKKFVREQESALREFIRRANDDFQCLKNAVIKNNAGERTSINVDYQNDKSEKENVQNTVISNDEINTPNVLENHERERIPSIPGLQASLDSEGLFLLDGIEYNNIPEEDDHSEEDQSDTDDSGSRDEGIHIPRRERISMAKSLPINVRVNFGHTFRPYDDRFEDDDDKSVYRRKIRDERPVDIAASMKALAKSVHDDTIFGDLPPPRIGSRI